MGYAILYLHLELCFINFFYYCILQNSSSKKNKRISYHHNFDSSPPKKIKIKIKNSINSWGPPLVIAEPYYIDSKAILGNLRVIQSQSQQLSSETC